MSKLLSFIEMSNCSLNYFPQGQWQPWAASIVYVLECEGRVLLVDVD